MSRPVIPFNKPHLAGPELAYIADAVARGNTAGDGVYSDRCRSLLAAQLGVESVLLTNSCTAALEIAALSCGVGPGDEVIMPSFTFVSTASAFVRAGARPVFVDIRSDTCNLDEGAVADAVTPRTRAIVPVHYGGVACEMRAIEAIARRHGVRIVEDAAQAVGATYQGRALGSFGDFGCLSFHETKHVHCGQGGALVVRDPADHERAQVLRDRGTDRQRFFRGEVDRYRWVDVGSAFAMSELAAAYLCAQLESLPTIAAARATAYGWYAEALEPLARREWLRLPTIPRGCSSSHHLFPIRVRDEATRDALLAHLQAHGIGAVIHYVPLHNSPFGQRLGPQPRLPVTDAVAGELLRLPLFHDLAATDVDRIADCIRGFFVDRSV